MKINGSPATKALFGCDSEDDNLFDDIDIPEPSGSSSCFTTPVGKRSRVTPPSSVISRAPSISPLSAAVSKSVKGVYGSQETTSPVLQSNVWNSVQHLKDKNPVLEQFTIGNVIRGTCLYRGKSAHLSVMIKSVECISNQDTSLIVCDETGMLHIYLCHTCCQVSPTSRILYVSAFTPHQYFHHSLFPPSPTLPSFTTSPVRCKQ